MKLLDQLRTEIRFRHYNIQTEKSYFNWVNNIKWAKRPRKLPVVFSKTEIARIMPHLKDVYWVQSKALWICSGLTLDSGVFKSIKKSW